MTLAKICTIPIIRHVKIRAKANPYDPEFEEYFEQRTGYLWERSIGGKTRLNQIWRRQNGLCPQCEQMISQQTGWHIHHRMAKSNGGDDSMANLVLLHPTCHRQLHSVVTGSPKVSL